MGLNLHTHLEGSVRPETAAELARAATVPIPPDGWERALRMDAPADLTVFLAHVAAAYPVLASAEAMQRTVFEAVEDAAADGCDYLELRFGPATHARARFDVGQVVGAACQGLRDGVAATGLPAGMVVCALRHDDVTTNLDVARAAAAHAGRGVVGFDLAGDELLYPALEPFVAAFRIAEAAGLGLTAHAAEAGPPAALTEAVRTLGVRRIGHGTRAAERDDIVAWVAREGVAIEVCLSSNVLTGAAPSLAAHPVRRFVDAGCRVVLGDDDPVTTGSRLSAEERLFADVAGEAARRAVDATALEMAFCDDSTRARIRERVAARSPEG